LMSSGKIQHNPLLEPIAATSVALIDGEFWVDPDYAHDLVADADVTVALNASRQIVEIQGAAEKKTYSKDDVIKLLDLADSSLQPLFDYYVAISEDIFSHENETKPS